MSTESFVASDVTTSGTQYIRLENGHFQCPHCPKVCSKQNTMYYHIKKTHDRDFRFECTHCVKAPKFVQKSAYLQHIAVCHPEIAEENSEANPYAGVSWGCAHPDCTHTTKTKANILVHFARTHCKDWIPAFTKDISCKQCTKTFASSTAYFYHSISCVKPIPDAYHTMLDSMMIRVPGTRDIKQMP